ncbi:MAG: hypothetical protein KW802_03795 [Candidatus Doudnabacteria bacterium]|nr:hypothetical protein [Candidatus Doudnabacteria bacterium]
MSYQKRKRRRGKKERRPIPPARTILLLTAHDIEKLPALEVGKRLQKNVFPRDRKYNYAVAVFGDNDRIRELLSYAPDTIVMVVRMQDLVGVTEFYEHLSEARARLQDYSPDLKVWEVELRPGEIPPLYPQLVPSFRHIDSVIADIQINRSQRNLLN